MKRVLSYIFLCLVVGSSLHAQSFADEEAELPFIKKKRIDISYTYQHFDPKKMYGNLQAGTLYYTHPYDKNTTFIANVSYITRKEGRGSVGQLGIYHDWDDAIYTFTTVAAGTNSDYLPRYRVDHEVYFKFGAKKSLVIPFGGYYAKYYTGQSSFVVGTGILYYLPLWILEYRICSVLNNPDRHRSVAHKAAIGFGREGWQWIFLSGNYGRDTYSALYLPDPEDVNRRVAYVDLNWRYWVRCNYGFVADINYTNIKDAYNVYGGSLGIFWEF